MARVNGRLTLRDKAQVHPDEMHTFQDTMKHQWFNTNNLWFDLEQLAQALKRHNGLAPLPVIVNQKRVDPRDPTSTPVVQLENAMGAALSWLQNSAVLSVPRTRFLPVKTTSDLLYVRSDALQSSSGDRLRPIRYQPTQIQLDPELHRHVDQLDRAFPYGAPSLRECDSLTVTGDVRFGRNVRCVGEVELTAREGETLHVPDGRVLIGVERRMAA